MKTLSILLLGLLCARCVSTSPTHPIHIVSSGRQDCDILCNAPGYPIIVKSDYCGFNQNSPLVMSNGSVNIFIDDGVVTMIGWDDGDLKRGGQVDLRGGKVNESSSTTSSWWNDIMKRDKRFVVIKGPAITNKFTNTVEGARTSLTHRDSPEWY